MLIYTHLAQCLALHISDMGVRSLEGCGVEWQYDTVNSFAFSLLSDFIVLNSRKISCFCCEMISFHSTGFEGALDDSSSDGDKVDVVVARVPIPSELGGCWITGRPF